MLIVLGRSILSLFSKSMQYAAISYIPLSMSSCISFTTGPIFAAIFAFIMIREKLTLGEIVPILFGILGTMMITMPQWFLWLGIDSAAIQARLEEETKVNLFYFLGIILALSSSALDVVTYFIIRKVGNTIPKALFPFISGGFSSTMMLIYISIYDPLEWGYFFRSTPSGPDIALDTKDQDYTTAIQLSILGCFFGWIGLEFMVIGLNISKSALASYGEMAGITVPFIFDGLVMGREFVTTDFLGLLLIILLQIFRAIRSMKESEEETKKKEQELLDKDEEDAQNENLYTNQKVDTEDGYKKVKNGIN